MLFYREISLMHLVRKSENPYSEQIKAFEKDDADFDPVR